MTSDTARLDWLEAHRATVGAVTSDEFREGTPPKLLRYYVEDGGWMRTGDSSQLMGETADALTLREAIDKAMEAYP